MCMIWIVELPLKYGISHCWSKDSRLAGQICHGKSYVPNSVHNVMNSLLCICSTALYWTA